MSDIWNNVNPVPAEVPILTQTDIQTVLDMFGADGVQSQSKCTQVHQHTHLLHPSEILGPQYPLLEHWNTSLSFEDEELC